MEHVNELVFLLPEYELEGYPRKLSSESAARVLSGWVALWHPTLLCGVGRIPRWHQASRLPSDISSALFVLPPISIEALENGAEERIREAGGLLLQPPPSWREFQSELLAIVPSVQPGELAKELSADFAALGYGYLQVQLMTRQLRYTSNLDVALFEEQVLRATEAVMEEDQRSACSLLQACFDTLGQERDHYYSNDAHLMDFTLIAETTLGKSVERQLADPHPTTVIASVELLRRMKSRSESAWNRFRERVSEGSICLLGGLETEGPMPLMPRESNVRAFYRAPTAYRELDVEPPTVFARLRHGLQADSPALLTRFNFMGAILIAFTGGRYPIGGQPKISWESQDGSRLPTLATEPLDAADPSTYLALGWTVGEALDKQHVPTVVFAHWPAASSDFFELLRIVTARTPALGKWCLVDNYFSDTESPYHHQRLEANAFVYDWLAESHSPGNLILAVKLMHKLQTRARCLQNMANLVWQLENRREKPTWSPNDSGELSPPTYSAARLSQWAEPLDLFLSSLDRMMDVVDQPIERYRELQSVARQISDQYLQKLQSMLIRSRGSNPGRLLFNPRSNPVRIGVRMATSEALPQTESWHFASGHVGENRVTCVDLPSMGFVVSPIQQATTGKPENIVLADSAGLLKNEFVEAQIDTKRGHLLSLHIPAVRGNRLSAMVAFRESSGAKTEYSEMLAKQVTMLTCSNMMGIIRSKGYLQYGGKSIGAFEIDYEINRGSRIVALKVTLSDLQYPSMLAKAKPNGTSESKRNPWQGAFVLRWAWPTEAAVLRIFPEGRRTPWIGPKAIATDLIEIDEVNYKTYVLTGGLAFHCREDLRFAETVLAVDGQASVRHRIGLGVDLPYPLPAARQFMDKPYEIAVSDMLDSINGWLLSVDSKNIMVDLESPLLDAQDKTVGLRALVSEMAGKATTARIRWFRDVGQAHRVNFLGGKMTRLTTNGDEVTIAMRANEQAVVDLLWKT